MADRDQFRSKMPKAFEKAVEAITNCDVEAAVERSAYGVTQMVRQALKIHPDVFQDHLHVVASIAHLSIAERDAYILDPLPQAPSKTLEVLRRSTLSLSIDLQFGGATHRPDALAETLLARWMVDVQEYELLARYAVRVGSGEENSSDCIPATVAQLREVTEGLFLELAKRSDKGRRPDGLKLPKPDMEDEDAGEAAVRRIAVKRPERKNT